jgi:hypothetical protein
LSFLAPIWLALAAAAAVPIVIHLLRRRIGTRVEFPAVRYIERAEREHSRSLRLRNLLLMVLRVAIVLAVALAAARPLASWAGGGHAPTAIALVLDNSLSTTVIVGGRPLLEDLKEAAVSVLRASAPDDRLWLVTADGRIRSGSAAELTEVARSIEALQAAGDLPLAIERAVGAVRAAPLDSRVLVLVSDGQRSAFGPAKAALQGVPVVAWLPDVALPPNRAVIEAVPASARWTPRGEIAVRVASPDSAAFRVGLRTISGPGGDHQTVARGVALPGARIRVQVNPAVRGWAAGVVELEPDELALDDVRHFVVWVGRPPGVSVSPAAGPFARAAVEALRSASRVTGGSDFSVTSAEELTTLPALITAPSDPLAHAAANRALARAGVPWRFGRARPGRIEVRGEGMDGVETVFRYELAAVEATPSETLATGAGTPWIVGGDNYVIVASPLHPEATSLPVRAAFIPWLGRVIANRASGDAATIVEAEPGSRITLGGTEFAVPASAGVHATETPTRRYFIVANPAAGESDLRRLSAGELESVLTDGSVTLVRERGALAGEAFRRSSRKPVSEPLIAIGILLLLAESLVSAPAHRRTA